jgi:GxxExxY protein
MQESDVGVGTLFPAHENPPKTVHPAMRSLDYPPASLMSSIALELEVHKVLGPGFAESVYEEALAVELSRREIPFERQVRLTVKYKGFCVGEGRADLLVGGELIIELKSVEQLAAVHIAQVISYLKASERPLGLLITFNVALLKNGIRRVVNSRR